MSLPRLYKDPQGAASGFYPPPPTPDHFSRMTDTPVERRADSSSNELPTFADTPSHQGLRTDEPQQEVESEEDAARTCDCANEQPRQRTLRLGDGLGKWNPALTLENSGSVARDHLASERTFLAYVRTSLTIASTGVGECSKPALIYGSPDAPGKLSCSSSQYLRRRQTKGSRRTRDRWARWSSPSGSRRCYLVSHDTS